MNKKLIFAVVSVLILLIIITVSISAFQVDDSYTVITAKPTRNAVQNMLDVFSLQQNLGFISSDFSVISISFDNDINCTVLLASKSTSSISVSSSGSLRTYSGSTRSIIPYVWTSSGWSYPYNGRNPTNTFSVYAQFHYYSSITVSAAGSYAGFTGLNSNFVFGSSDSSSSSVLQYYTTYSERLFGYDSAVSEAHSEGYSEGYGTGYDSGAIDGYDMGYNVGYDIGFDYGHDRGYNEGQTEGYSEGYSEGESYGYNEGYPDGYDTGFNHGYQFGYQDGIETGRSEGYIQGEAAGYASGYDTGYQDGYDIGLDDGYESGYSEGYETGYDEGLNNSDFNKPGQIKAYFWRYRNDSEFQGNVYFSSTVNEFGNTLYRWCTREELETHWQGFTVFEFTYDTNLYFQKNPLEFDYYIPQIVRDNGAAAYSIKEVKYEYVDLYERRALIELSIDGNLVGVLNGKYQEGIRDSNALVNGVSNIATKPIKSLKDALDFDIFGINIGAVAVGLVAILFAIWAYNKIRKILPI